MPVSLNIYNELLEYAKKRGNILEKERGKIRDIGVRKQYLTEEDINIERELKKIIQSQYPNHKIFAEEENNSFEKATDLWVIDPISGTKLFIEGKAHYAIIISHVHKGKVIFSLVHDPSNSETYYAERGKGSFRNGEQISCSNLINQPYKFIINRSSIFKPCSDLDNFLQSIDNISHGKYQKQEFVMESNGYSMGINYCKAASGSCDGVVAFTKDIFPEIAGSLIVKEAGGEFLNLDGTEEINCNNKIFVCGGKNAVKVMFLNFHKNRKLLKSLETRQV